MECLVDNLLTIRGELFSADRWETHRNEFCVDLSIHSHMLIIKWFFQLFLTFTSPKINWKSTKQLIQLCLPHTYTSFHIKIKQTFLERIKKNVTIWNSKKKFEMATDQYDEHMEYTFHCWLVPVETVIYTHNFSVMREYF